MPLKYKVNVLEALKSKGFTTYQIRKEKLLSEGTLQRLRDNAPLSWENLERVCTLLNCDISEILEFKKD